MTNGNAEPCICVGIGEPTHDASTPDDMTRGDANEKERGREELTLTSYLGLLSVVWLLVVSRYLGRSNKVPKQIIQRNNRVLWIT